MSETFQHQRDILSCLCRRHNIGHYTPADSERFDKIKHNFYIKFEREGRYGPIVSKPNLVGPLGFIHATDDGAFRVFVTSTWPWTRSELPRVTLRTVIKPGETYYSYRGVKRETAPRTLLFIEGGDQERELKALKAIGLRPLCVTWESIRNKWNEKYRKLLASAPDWAIDPW